MNRTPKVSVLMPSSNYARYLALAIEGVLSQSHADLELIITDDCSTEGSRETAEQEYGGFVARRVDRPKLCDEAVLEGRGV